PVRRPVGRDDVAEPTLRGPDPVVDRPGRQRSEALSPLEVDEDIPVVELTVPPGPLAPPSRLDIGAGVAQRPHPLAVEAFQDVRDVHTPGAAALHPQSERMVVTGDDLDEGSRASAEMPVPVPEGQALAEPHAG